MPDFDDEAEAEVCPDCGAVEGTEEWGTVGDGFDGYCPSCADAREDEVEDDDPDYDDQGNLKAGVDHE